MPIQRSVVLLFWIASNWCAWELTHQHNTKYNLIHAVLDLIHHSMSANAT